MNSECECRCASGRYVETDASRRQNQRREATQRRETRGRDMQQTRVSHRTPHKPECGVEWDLEHERGCDGYRGWDVRNQCLWCKNPAHGEYVLLDLFKSERRKFTHQIIKRMRLCVVQQPRTKRTLLHTRNSLAVSLCPTTTITTKGPQLPQHLVHTRFVHVHAIEHLSNRRRHPDLQV